MALGVLGAIYPRHPSANPKDQRVSRRKLHMNYISRGRVCLALLIATLASPSFAANLDFNNPDGSWFTPANWTPPGPPAAADNARIGTTATLATAIARINTGGTANANIVVVGHDAGTDRTLRINSGSTLAIANNF